MSVWNEHDMEQRVRDALGAVHLNNPQGHHLGRPFLSSYQIAVALEAADPGFCDQIGKRIGGRGTGESHSLPQYIGNELSKQIRQQGDTHYAEGVFMSNERVREIVYAGPDGADISSSLAGTGFDMALFRLRE